MKKNTATAVAAKALPASLIRAFTRATIRIDDTGKVQTSLPPALHRNRYRVIEAARDYLRRESAAGFAETVARLMLSLKCCSEAAVIVEYEPAYDDNGGTYMSCFTRMELLAESGEEVWPDPKVCDDAGEYLQESADYAFLEGESTKYRFTRQCVERLLVDGDYDGFLASAVVAAEELDATSA